MRFKRVHAFTLIELLVAVGIIALLVGLLAPMAYRAFKSGKATKVKADLAAISSALEAYKADFGDYPRSTADNTGFAALCRALVAPGGSVAYNPDTDGSPMDPSVVPPTFSASTTYKAGDIVLQGAAPVKGANNTSIYVCTNAQGTSATPSSTSPNWALFWPFDGEQGPGFRSRPTIGGVKQGKVHGPYLNPGRMTVRGMALVDGEGNPILYFAAAASKPDVTKTNGYVGYVRTPPVPAGTERSPLYDERQGLVFFRQGSETDDTNATRGMRTMLGDMNSNGQIDTGENETVALPYLLWAAGADGFFGPKTNRGNPAQKDVADCDDVTNFR